MHPSLTLQVPDKDSHPSSQRSRQVHKPEPTSHRQGCTVSPHGLRQGLQLEPRKGPIPYLSCLYTFDATFIGTRIRLIFVWNNEVVRWLIRSDCSSKLKKYCVRILVGSAVYHRSFAYTVLQTVQSPGVCSDVYGIVQRCRFFIVWYQVWRPLIGFTFYPLVTGPVHSCAIWTLREHTVLQPLRRIELIVHIAISVLPGTHFYLSQVKHLRVKCLAQGHTILTISQDWEERNMIFLSPSGIRNRTTSRDIGRAPLSNHCATSPSFK